MIDEKKNTFKYQKEFDVLRAISVIFVIFFHLNENLFFFGFVGVDIFFVISGYVITQSLFNYYYDKGQKGFIINFFFRRVKRIYPILLFVLVFSIFIYFIIIPYGDHQFLWTAKSLIFSIFGLSNIYFFKNIDSFNYFNFENTTPFLHTWSLGVEEQFYFFFPFLLIFFLKNKINLIYLKFLFLILIFGSLLIFITNSYAISHFYLLPSRAWELILGSILFLYRNRIKLNINLSIFKLQYLIILFLIISIMLFYFEKNIDYRHLVILSITILLIFFNFENLKKKIIFENYFIYIGKLSYSLYLWHFPILFFSSYYIQGAFKYILVISLTLLFSHLSYYFIEVPARKFQISFKKIKNIFLVFICAIFVFILLQALNYINIRTLINHGIINLNNSFKNINLTTNTIEYRIANKWFLNNDSCNNNLENFGHNYLNCIKNESNENLFFISGDSFGQHFVNVLTASKNNFNNIYLSTISNKSFVNENISYQHSINNFLHLSKNFDKSYFILSISHQQDFSVEKMTTFLDNLQNHDIIIIKPHQRTNRFIQNCIKYGNSLKIVSSYIDEKICEFDPNIDQKRIKIVNEKLEKISKLFSNVKLFDLNDLICKNEKCNLYNKKNSMIFFTDNTHITSEFAELISHYFEIWFRNEILR